jgi:parallel beta-helix repeat protein
MMRASEYRALLVAFALAISFCMLPASPIGPWSVMAQPPPTGDWIVENPTVLKDETHTLDGNLIVRSSGSLKLDNSTLYFKMDSDGQAGIVVETNGRLDLESGSLLAAKDATKRFTFDGRGEIYITDSRVSGTAGGLAGILSTGIVVKNGVLEMKRSTVTSSGGTGLALEHSTASIIDSNFENNDGPGIYIVGGTPHISGTTISGNTAWGIFIDDGASADVMDSVISDNGNDGIFIRKSSSIIENNTIASNSGHGVQCEDTLQGLVLRNNTIIDNSGWGVNSVGGEPDRGNNRFVDGNSSNSLGRVLQAWHLEVKVNGIDGSPWGGAEVFAKGSGGKKSGPLLTNDTGRVTFSNLIDYEVGNDGVNRTVNPYEITATLAPEDGGTSRSSTVVMNRNAELSLTIDPANLVISDIHTSRKNVRQGEEVVLSAVISNIGGTDANDVTVTFYDGSHVIKNRVLASVPQGGTQEVSVAWNTDDEDVGKHTIRIVVDPEDRIPETDEIDNEASVTVEVSETLRMAYAIPILLLIAILGLMAFKLRNYILLKRLQLKKEREEDAFEVVEEE